MRIIHSNRLVAGLHGLAHLARRRFYSPGKSVIKRATNTRTPHTLTNEKRKINENYDKPPNGWAPRSPSSVL